MQGFISSLRAPTYLPHVKAGATYTLQNFYAAKSKEIYCFADQSLIVSFSNNSVLKPLDDIRLSFAAVRFRCRWPLEADEWTVLEEAEIINMRHVLVHLQSKELSSNPKIAKRLNADEVTRAETMTIGQILAYIKQEYAKEGSFDCVATIDDVERDSAWYYIAIACIGCQSKTIKGPYSLMCAKCGNTNIAGEQGRELTGKNAVELVNNYFEANQELAVAHEMSAPPPPPLPQALIDTIEVLPPVPTPTEIPLDAGEEVDVLFGSVVCASFKDCGFVADERNESTNNKKTNHRRLSVLNM
ncbi:hypothetical protein Bca101_033916 [Brassica carinata]